MSGYAHALAAIERHLAPGSAPFGVLMVRLRKLRETELLFGHGVGQQLCQEMANLVREALRAQDEFYTVGECDHVVLLPGVRGEQHVELAAAKVARAFEHPVAVELHSMRARVTVGGAFVGDGSRSAEAVLISADRACAQAQRSRNRYRMAANGPMPALIDHNLLGAALRDNALELYLQPLHDLRLERIGGFEALARWRLPDGAQVSPSSFIALAEESGLIEDLTVWSVHAALRHLAAWSAFAPEVSCSINISPLFAADAAFPMLIERALAIWDVRPERVMLEITETAFADNVEAVIESMVALKQLGVGIAIDDFGTGYATFAYLKDFPASELKIDQVFIRNLTRDLRLRQLVSSMIDMSHRLGMPVVAEGVEDAATLAILAELDCDQAQGYHIGRPAPAEQALEHLRTHFAR